MVEHGFKCGNLIVNDGSQWWLIWDLMWRYRETNPPLMEVCSWEHIHYLGFACTASSIIFRTSCSEHSLIMWSLMHLGCAEDGFCMFLYSDVGMFEFPINIKKKNPMTSTNFRPVVSPPGCVSPAEDHLKGRRLQLFLNEPLGLQGLPDWRDFWDLQIYRKFI